MSVNRIISLCPVCSTKNSSSDRAFQHQVQYRAVNTDWTFLTCRTDQLNNFNLKLLGKPVIPTLLNGRCSSTPIFFFPVVQSHWLPITFVSNRSFSISSFYFCAWVLLVVAHCTFIQFPWFPPLPGQCLLSPAGRHRLQRKKTKRCQYL